MVLSAAVGAGHDAATQELSRRLVDRGFKVDCHDFLDLLPLRMGTRAVRGHNNILRRAPWVYGLLFGLGNRFRVMPCMTRMMLLPVRRRILRLVEDEVRVVVSTYPLASQVVGPLRRAGQLRIPVVTYSTDFAVHRHWVAPGMDVHLAPHEVGARQARAFGAVSAHAAGALVAGEFQPATPETRQAARLHFGLPDGYVALVVAGSWGVGQIEAAADEIAATGVAEPIVVCGRNVELRQRLQAKGVGHALGWVDDMPTLMQAVDVVVENAGGIMALEAMACGLPVLTYRPIPGHGHESAAALERAGVTTWVRHRRDLGAALTEVTAGVEGQWQALAARALFEADAAEAIAELASSKG